MPRLTPDNAHKLQWQCRPLLTPALGPGPQAGAEPRMLAQRGNASEQSSVWNLCRALREEAGFAASHGGSDSGARSNCPRESSSSLEDRREAATILWHPRSHGYSSNARLGTAGERFCRCDLSPYQFVLN